jgi:hypothetical protein
MLLLLVSLCTVLYNDTYIGYWTIILRLSECNFSCIRQTIGISILNIRLANSRNYRTIRYRIKAPVYRTIGYQTHKKLAVAHL